MKANQTNEPNHLILNSSFDKRKEIDGKGEQNK